MVEGGGGGGGGSFRCWFMRVGYGCLCLAYVEERGFRCGGGFF